jgi:antitoxin (DNA-binding transcriptional repressor) of toxin-antitoxin stability system
MARYNIAEAKARWSEMVRKALSGEDVIIARDNKPLLMLVPLTAAGGKRRPGSARGRIRMAADFDRTPDDFAEYTK